MSVVSLQSGFVVGHISGCGVAMDGCHVLVGIFGGFQLFVGGGFQLFVGGGFQLFVGGGFQLFVGLGLFFHLPGGGGGFQVISGSVGVVSVHNIVDGGCFHMFGGGVGFFQLIFGVGGGFHIMVGFIVSGEGGEGGGGVGCFHFGGFQLFGGGLQLLPPFCFGGQPFPMFIDGNVVVVIVSSSEVSGESVCPLLSLFFSSVEPHFNVILHP